MTKTTANKILEFGRYFKGWDYGEGEPFSKKTIQQALVLNRSLIFAGISQTDAFPGPDGDIMVTGYLGSLCWEFTIESDNTITFITENNGRIVEDREGISFSEALRVIPSLNNRRVRKNVWTHNLHKSFTPNDMIAGEVDLQVKYSNRPKIEVAYPPLKWRVCELEMTLFVPTSKNIILKTKSLESQLCFGSSMPEYCPQNIQLSRRSALRETPATATFVA